jgi:predicted nucleotide-binding protein (sugar kinase/HSP70/actin superfamily)
MGAEVILPDPTNRNDVKIDVKDSPEFVCFPFKTTLGDFVNAIEKGADTLALRLVERNRPFKLPKKKLKGDLKFLLLGHGYNIFDTFINLDFQKKLQDQGVEVLTIENMPYSVFKKPIIVNKRLRNYWRHEEEIIAAIRYYLTKGRGEIDGVIFLISFACGPDSLISELIMRNMKVVGLPFLEITMDEHSGEAGMITRIEAFLEMARRKKKKLAMDLKKEMIKT